MYYHGLNDKPFHLWISVTSSPDYSPANTQAEQQAKPDPAEKAAFSAEDLAGAERAAARRAAAKAVAARAAAAKAAAARRAEMISGPTAMAAAVAAAGPMAGPAKLRPRHRLMFLSFLVIVILPLMVSATYLWVIAKDQYASTVGFSVRREDASAASDILGGLTSLTKSSSSDTDILYEYLRSQKLVADMDARLDLRAIWSKPVGDPVFTLQSDVSIEDLLDYWQSMVRTSYDSSTGLIEVRVLAFDPVDAKRIARELLDQSAKMINDLSAVAREDAVRFSREELTIAEDRLRVARENVTAFRVKNQIVDPTTAFQTQAALISMLENQLAEAQIEIDLLAGAPETDPRLVQAKRRAEVIVDRISAERARVGDSAERKDFAALAADYERLSVDREFAEKSYVAALSAFDKAKAESLRTSRYLAAHVLPTTAEVSRYPERLSILGLQALFLGLLWSIGALVAYSLKDRR
jgi:capsular polysaccharide transport system permease protein